MMSDFSVETWTFSYHVIQLWTLFKSVLAAVL